MKTSVLHGTRRIRTVAEHPATKLGVGVLLLLTFLYEIEEGLWIEFSEQGPGSHHGVEGYGLITIGSALPDLLDSMIANSESYEQLRSESLSTSEKSR